MALIDWLTGYPPWVLVLEIVLIGSAVLLLIFFSPTKGERRDTSVPKEIAAVWGPFREGRCTVVVGTYYDQNIPWFEASALIGTGDALALSIVMNVLQQLGANKCDVLPSKNFPGDRLKDNLILVGGPDANEVTHRIVTRLPLRLKFGDPDRHEISIHNSVTNQTLAPKRKQDGTVVNDFGVAIKANNPFSETSKVIVIAGSFGHGTHAAAQFLHQEQLIRKVDQARSGQNFEALLETEVVGGWPQTPVLLNVYGM